MPIIVRHLVHPYSNVFGNYLVDQSTAHLFQAYFAAKFLVSRFVAKTWPAFRSLGRGSIAPPVGAPALAMDSTVRTLVVISLFAALCAIVAFVLDQQFVAAIFAAQFALALIEAVRRAG
jgi:hypothetical protein